MITGKLIGFIGGGNMAEAIIKGLLAGGTAAKTIQVAEPETARRDYLSSKYGVMVTEDNLEVALKTNVIVLAIKPQIATAVLTLLEPVITPEKLIISIMAGISTASIEKNLPAGTKVVRVMPNTPALIQAAASAVSQGSKASEQDVEITCAIFSLVGTVVTVPESQMDAVTALSGSGPAYVFTFIEALSDGGVKNGLRRDTATELAVQTILGAVRMVIETNEHPALLKEKVTSPGGTTIAGLHALELGSFRGVVMNAVDAASQRSKELSGK